ncbi:MAG: hypothetical protein B7Y26_03930 [Hydrogenophilales bacterium 16-64-46]|nr:MAG: hypothetical protein B7Z32_05260 [Hydrogenophilales bacterium 12-64-13]OYZ06136.1 MAG: hypothetical protein B7Y26_03930 [Hydrogenophilales bacterium 16-64-46]OZA38965.1 MAG: hypothetical protein B7X87_05960 [Hydrogenophilales bacterium 17-64-34]HQT01021.1 hypothetical protein [Thiobacillus sp.]
MTSLAGKFASGIARLTNLAKRDDDPLTNLKSASRWLDNLPVGDAFKSHRAILDEIKRFNENSSDLSKDRLAVLKLLDEKSRDLQDTLVRQYLRNPRMSRPMESKLWHTVYSLYWEIARGYHSFVLDFARSAGKRPHEHDIPLVTLRAIRVFGNLLKWRAMRYLSTGEKIWLRLHNLYRIAEIEGFHRTAQAGYAEESPCSCETAYLHVMMLQLANSGTLYPRQIDLIDRWLCQWHEHLSLETRCDIDRHAFAVDLSADHGPRRTRKCTDDKPVRYWGTTELLEKLSGLQRALGDGTAPASLGLTEDTRTSESLDILNHLQHHWSPLTTREQRRASRESVKRLLDVAQGFPAIVGQIKAAFAPSPGASPYGTGINFSEADDVSIYGFVTERTRERSSQMQTHGTRTSPDVERWVMQDESACGYGAIVESRDRDWLRVGTLLGLKSHDAAGWQLGVIRRLSRLNDDTSSIGIETLPETPSLVMLYETTSTANYTVNGIDNSGANLPHAALWLEGDSLSVILDPVHYAPGKILRFNSAGTFRFIALRYPVERSEGWIRVAAEPVQG